MYTKTSILIGAILLIAATNAQGGNVANCANNCAACHGTNCWWCYNAPWQGSGYHLCQTTAMPSYKCHDYYTSNCFRCFSGYVTSSSNMKMCSSVTTIPNCLSGQFNNGNQVCTICDHGFYPSVDKTQCLSSTAVTNPITHCLWGNRNGSQLSCSFCSQFPYSE